MSQPVFNARITLNNATPLTVNTWQFDFAVFDTEGVFNGNDVAIDDIVALDTGGAAPGTISRYRITSIISQDALNVSADVIYDDNDAPQDATAAIFLDGLVCRPSVNFKFFTTADPSIQSLPSKFVTYPRNSDFAQRVDNLSAGMGGTQDPTVTATNAGPGQIYYRTVTPFGVYQKLDSGSTTNWTLIAGGIMDSLTLGGRTFTNLTGLVMLPSGQARDRNNKTVALFNDPRSLTPMAYQVPGGKTLTVLAVNSLDSYAFGYADSVSPSTMPQSSRIQMPEMPNNGSPGFLNNKVIFLDDPSGPIAYLWFNSNGAGVNPGPFGGRIAVEVGIADNWPSSNILDTMAPTMNAALSAYFNTVSPGGPSNILLISNLAFGSSPVPNDNGTGTGLTFDIVTLSGSPLIDAVSDSYLVNPVYVGKGPEEFLTTRNLPYNPDAQGNPRRTTDNLISIVIPAGKVPFIQTLEELGPAQVKLYGLEV